MADPRTRRESGNRTRMLSEIHDMLDSMGVLENILKQYDGESAPRIGDEFTTCVTNLKYRFDTFAFRLKSLLPDQATHPMSLGFEDIMQREVHALIRRVTSLERVVESQSRGVYQQTRRIRQRR